MVTDTVLKYPSKDPTALFGAKYVAAWRVIFHVIVVKKTSKLKELTIYKHIKQQCSSSWLGSPGMSHLD